MLREIVLPEATPEMEWVRGRPLQKVIPQRDHSRLQGALVTRLDSWAAERGKAGPEWRFRVAPPGEARRPLVSDVAYASNERLRALSYEELQVPPWAPDDRRADVDDRVDTYLRAGSLLVIVVDSSQRVVELHDGSRLVRLGERDAIEHEVPAGFHYPVAQLFAVLRRK